MTHPAFTFIANGKPAAQGSKRHLGRGIMVEASKRLPGWRNDVAFAAQQAMPVDWPRNGAMRLDLVFRFARPQSHYNSRGELKPTAPQFHTTATGDIDKLTRAIGDSLTAAAVWLDDAQLVEMHVYRVFASNTEPPGVTGTVTALEHRR